MLRSFLLLLCSTVSVSLGAKDRWEGNLPRPGQFVEIWNGDLSQKLGRTRIEVREDHPLYTLSAENLPILHFMMDEQRFSIPGVAATGRAQVVDQPGILRWIFRGSNSAGAVEKQALIEVVRLDTGSCQLSWKLSVMNRGERVRDQEGAITYGCQDESKTKKHRREAMQLLPEQDFSKR